MNHESLEQLYELFLMHGKVTTDTRQCKPGNIFFALTGDNFDGNAFVPEALSAGCSVAVTSNHSYKGIDNVFVVDNTLIALQQLATHHRKMLDIPIIGITGSNGKTTTKELLSTVLQKKFNVFFTQGNLNNHIGVPLTLLSMNNSTEIGVVEMGANHIGEIRDLCNICRPNLGIITNIGKAHLEGFGSYEGVITAKSELYSFINQTGGKLFVNASDHLLMELSHHMSRSTYGKASAHESMVEAETVSASPFLSFELKNNTEQENIAITTQLLGAYNIDNALVACCVGAYYGISNQEMKDALEAYVPSNNRSQMVKTEYNQVLMDAYNANPSSMKAAIDNFALIDYPNKTLILGGMRELGDDSAMEHNNLLGQLQAYGFDSVLLVGSEFNTTNCPSDYNWFPSTNELLDFLKQHPIKNRFILVKGSRSNKLEAAQTYL